MDNHSGRNELNFEGGVKCHAFWSEKPSGKAVVFVHGFRGSSESTWNNFPVLLKAHRQTAGTDIVMFGYKSGLPAAGNAALFELFLARLIENRHALSGGQKPNYHSAPKIVIAAHSLGALIARRAMITAYRNNRTWAEKIDVVLYAPAHMGAAAWGLLCDAMSIFGRFSRPTQAVAKLRWPVITDLAGDSRFIADLLRDMMQQTQNWKIKKNLIAKKVVIGTADRVVSMHRFGEDPEITPVPEVAHSEVCKPRAPSDIAMEALMEHL